MKGSSDELEVVYVSRLCSPEIFSDIFQTSGQKLGQQDQKYHRLMVEGIAAHKGVRVNVVGVMPVTRNITKKIFFSSKSTIENNITYWAVSMINFSALRHFSVFYGVMRQIFSILRRKQKSIIICDISSKSMEFAALVAAWLLNVKTVGIATDLYESQARSQLMLRINESLRNCYSSYLFLTHDMNAIANRHNKPYVVIEGQVDIHMTQQDNELCKKPPNRVCLYTGSLVHVNGVLLLAEAFLLANIQDVDLWFYGVGDLEAELVSLANQHKSIKFGGTLPNKQILKEQTRATLLINPRPTNQVFTRFSFPSKNMEYLASGTPLLTTKLPCIPDDHKPHVYFFEDDTVEAFASTLKEVLSLSAEELHRKGTEAKEFALAHKNNVVQAGKLMQMIKREVLTL